MVRHPKGGVPVGVGGKLGLDRQISMSKSGNNP